MSLQGDQVPLFYSCLRRGDAAGPWIGSRESVPYFRFAPRAGDVVDNGHWQRLAASHSGSRLRAAMLSGMGTARRDAAS